MFHVRLRRLRTLLLLGWVFYICLFGLVGLVLFKSSISLLTLCLDVLSSTEDEILKLQCAVIELSISPFGVSLVAQKVKRLPAMWETRVQSLGWEDPLEKEMATHPSILAWRILWILPEEPGRLQSTGSQRVGHD